MFLVLATQYSENTNSNADTNSRFEQVLPRLPESRRDKLNRVRHRQTRITSMLGLLLLREGMQRLDVGDFSLHEIVYREDHKPHCPDRYDFNISHSHGMVVCAISTGCRVGIDVEHLRDIRPERFARLLELTGDVTNELTGPRFFELWTQKEAVIKADGTGGVWDIGKVRLEHNNGLLRDQHWQLAPVKMPPGYVAHLAHDSQNSVSAVIEPLFLDCGAIVHSALNSDTL